jgi:hypothetical protein
MPMLMGPDVQDVVEFITSLPETRALFAGKPPDKITATVEDLRRGLAPYDAPEGVVMEGAAWLVSARRR